MRHIRRKLRSYWSEKNRGRATRGKWHRDAIAGNHAKNKRMNISFKGLMMKRKWKNPKLGYKRKRYYSRSWT